MALDFAARSLALAHLAQVSKQEAATLNSLESYSQALAFLSRALNRPDTRYSSETVAATMLLGLFEVCLL
jgi:Fungal specific transcription factor domain